MSETEDPRPEAVFAAMVALLRTLPMGPTYLQLEGAAMALGSSARGPRGNVARQALTDALAELEIARAAVRHGGDACRSS